MRDLMAQRRNSVVKSKPALERGSPAGREWAAVLFLAIVTLLVFAPAFGAEFTTWDDNLNISRNPSMNPPMVATIARFWKEPYLDLYVPLTYTLWGLLAAVARLPVPDPSGIQLNAAVFHGANVLVHIAAVLMAYALLRRLLRQTWPAAAGALLFAIHPIQVEPVAWITGMKDVLCGALSIAALWQYFCFADERQGPRLRARRGVYYALAWLAFVLALLSKPSAVTVPLLAIVLDFWVLRRPWQKVLASAGPMLALSVAGMIFLTAKIQTVVAPADGGHIALRPLIASDALAFYLRQLALPLQFAIHYDRAPMTVIQHGWLYWTWITPALVALAVFMLRRKIPMAVAAGLLFLTAVAPVLGLVPFAYQRYSTVADRYVYVSMIGPALLLGAALCRRAIPDLSGKKTTGLAHERIPKIAITALAASFLMLAVHSFVQARTWHDNDTLFTHALEVNPHSFLACNGLSAEYMSRKRPDLALPFAKRATELAPRQPEGFVNLGSVHEALGEHDMAVEAFNRAVELAPESAVANNALGQALVVKDRDRAESLFRKAIAIKPEFAAAHLNLGTLLFQNRRYDASFEETRLAVRLDGGDPRARTNYALLLLGKREPAAAREQLEIALQIDPQFQPAISLYRRMMQAR